ncbi:MAG: hypothetical protein DCC71_08890 [Proteobacteria bacterium]|nr:MAG: hypothetical protein DCC71_08890 [Pseudomonadota bacterium]
MRREAGSALIVTVMLLLLLGVIGLSALDTVMRDQQVAGFQNRSTAAFYAAEAGVAAAKDIIRGQLFYTVGESVTFASYSTPAEIGDTSLYPNGRPRYYGDPDVTQPITALPQTLRSPGAGGSNMRQGAQAFNTFGLYRLRVVGQTADGATSKIEAVTLNNTYSGY